MGIKIKIANWLLNSKLGSVTRKKKVFNIDSAKTVGILWEYNQKESFDRIEKELKSKGIKTLGLCYFESRKAIIPENVNGFSRKQTNWFEIPKAELAKEFIRQKFDVLIDLTSLRLFPLIYVTALSEAAFKIGYAGAQVNYFDLNIEFGEQPETSKLAEQILYYFKRINKTTIE